MEKTLDKIIQKFVVDVNKLYEGEALDGDETEFVAEQVLNQLNIFNANK